MNKKLLLLLLSACCFLPAAFASPQRGDSAAKSLAFADDTPSPNPYVTSGLVAMWDAEWNAGFGVHDPDSPVWLDLVGNNNMVLNPASVWNDQYLLNPANTKGAIAQRWADDAVTIEVVMRIKGFYKYYNTVFVVYNKFNDAVFRGIGKRFEHLTNGVKQGFYQVPFTRTSVFQASFFMDKETWGNNISFIDNEMMSSTRITVATHTIDEDAVYINAGSYDVEYYTIRLYSRELTDAERSLNYETDRLRFNLP